MTSKRKRARRYLRWTRYQHRIDKLTEHQDVTSRIMAPMRCNPGFFRAESWPRRTLDRGPSLRHGA